MTDETKQVPSLAELMARKPIESTTLVFMTEAERDALVELAEAYLAFKELEARPVRETPTREFLAALDRLALAAKQVRP